MPAVLLRFFGALKPRLSGQNTVSGDLIAIPFLMSYSVCTQSGGLKITNSFRGLVRCRGLLRGIGLVSGRARKDWFSAGVPCAQESCFSSSISVPLGSKAYNSRLHSSALNLSFAEAEKPDMLDSFSKVKDVPETSVKELDKKDEETEEEKVRKDEQQRKQIEEAEKLRKEKEIEDKIGPPPEKPIPGDCCGNGCTPCVWDTYWDELEDYKKLRKTVEES